MGITRRVYRIGGAKPDKEIWKVQKLGFVFLFVLLCGAAIAFLHYKTNKRIFYSAIIATIIITVSWVVFIQISIERMHKTEINKVIQAKDGIILDISKKNDAINKIATTRYNTVYKITYKSKNGEVKTAWYRAVNSISDIHKRKKGLGELWMIP